MSNPIVSSYSLYNIKKKIPSYIYWFHFVKGMQKKYGPSRFDILGPNSFRLWAMKPLTIWDKATMLRHLWAMSKKSESLWVKWVHMYIINHQETV